MTETALKEYSIDEIRKHNKPNDIWLIIDEYVYDVSRFIHEHPGGKDALIKNAGKDVTDLFDNIHSTNAKKLKQKFLIGKVKK